MRTRLARFGALLLALLLRLPLLLALLPQLLALTQLLHHRLSPLRSGRPPLLAQLLTPVGGQSAHPPERFAHGPLLLGWQAFELLPALANEALLVR